MAALTVGSSCHGRGGRGGILAGQVVGVRCGVSVGRIGFDLASGLVSLVYTRGLQSSWRVTRPRNVGSKYLFG